MDWSMVWLGRVFGPFGPPRAMVTFPTMRENAVVDGGMIHISAILTGEPNAASGIMVASVDGDRPVTVEKPDTDERSFPTTHISPGVHEVKVWRTRKDNPKKIIPESEFVARYCVGPCPTIPHGHINLSVDSLTFSSAVGGALPPAQAVKLSNSGVAPMNFAVRTDQPFCDVRPYRGRLEAGESATFTVVVKALPNPGSVSAT